MVISPLSLTLNDVDVRTPFLATLRAPEGDMVTLRVIETLAVDEQGLISRMRAHFDSDSIS